MKISKKDFTHYAWFYGLPCYWHDEAGTLAGRFLLVDYLIIAMTSFHNTFVQPFFPEAGFPIAITGEIE